MANDRVRTRISSNHSVEESMDSMKADIVQLSSELESERKCIRRLRRERAYELQLARDQEQTRTAVAVKEMAATLQQANEQETRILRCRQKTDIDKVVRRKDKEIKKLKQDLVRCQDALKDENYRRGLSTSARVAFDLERSKMLREIRELNASKRHVEDALCSATEATKHKSAELQRLQDAMRCEIAKVNREANTEIKRLLEELKIKDSSSSVSKSVGDCVKRRLLPRCHQTVHSAAVDGLATEIESWKRNLSTVEEGAEAAKCGQNLPNFTLQRKLYDLEKQIKHLASVGGGFTEKNNQLRSLNNEQEKRINCLIEQNRTLENGLKSSKGEIKRLKDLMSANGINDLTLTLKDLYQQVKDYENAANSKKKNSPKKTVRFLLTDGDEDVCPASERGGGGGDEGGRGKEKDKPAKLSSAAISTGENVISREWQVQRESLFIVIQTLEEELKKCEENEDRLKLKLKETCERNEELEFQILELENSADEQKSQWQKETESLKSELSDLEDRLRVIKNESSDIMERNVATQCDQEMLDEECLEQQNSFHDLTDDHKLSVRAKVECSDDVFSPVMQRGGDGRDGKMTEVSKSTKVSSAHLMLDIKRRDGRGVAWDVVKAGGGGGGDDGRSPMAHGTNESQMESLKRKLTRSQIREQQMKDQLMLLEEEKNRHLKLLQRQIECLERSQDPIFGSSAQRSPTEDGAKEIERPSPEGLEDAENPESFGTNRAPGGKQGGKTVRLKLDTTLHWVASSTTDAFNSTPLSGDCNLSRKLDYDDSRREQLCRQISDLERDREILQEIVQSNENTVCELRTEIYKLHQSEKDLHGIVDRLENAEEQLRTNADSMAACNADMERQLKQLKTSEDALLSNLKKSRSVESELKLKIEEIADEKFACNTAWKRRLTEVEIEQTLLRAKVKELDDQVGDLEASECILKQKLKRRKLAESCLQTELDDARRDLNAALDHVSELEYERELLAQNLDATSADLAAERVRRKQEKEAMNLEMVETNRKIRFLEESISGREAAVSALESKCLELESDEMRMQEDHRTQFASDDECMLHGDGRTFPLGLQEQLEFFGGICDDECTNDGKPLDDYVNPCSVSISSFLSSGGNPSDGDVDSADEASEIADDDAGGGRCGGAYLAQENCSLQRQYDECWPSSSSSRDHAADRSTDSPTLDSVCDSGLESLKQEHGHNSCHDENSVRRDTPPLRW